MTVHNCHCTDEYRGRPPNSGWREAFAALASPVVRLHHLRNIRTQMMRNALGDLDDCNKEDEDA